MANPNYLIGDERKQLWMLSEMMCWDDYNEEAEDEINSTLQNVSKKANVNLLLAWQ